jgi:hypothetical protein
MQPIRTLLFLLSLTVSLSVCAQSQGVMTVEASPSGSTQVRYFIASTYCNWGFPQTTQATPMSSGWNITTVAGWPPGMICFTLSPPGAPATLIVDLGYLRKGEYTVTWNFTGGIGYGARSTTFTIAEDQVASAVPTLSPAMVVLLSLLVVIAYVGLRRESFGR